MAIAALAPAAPTRPRGDLTDHELVAAVRCGDDEAFEQLYTRYRRRIASYIAGMVQDHARAEDITQDVFMSALRRMRETDRPIAFKPWVYEIAKNACIDQFRRSRRAEEVSYDADEALGPADQGRLASRGPSPDVAVERKQQLDDLRGAFGGLSDAHHQILVMRELEGLSYREIGERLGMTRPSVESTLFRARRRLSEEYEDLATGARCERVQAIVLEAAGGALGMRDRRKLGRHISHCRPCLRQARLAGLDTASIIDRPSRTRIAALLPLPAFLRRRGGSDDGMSSLVAGPHALAQFSTAASQYMEPGIAGWAKAAAAAVTIAVAGTGVNMAAEDRGAPVGGGHERVHRAAGATPAAPKAPAAAPVVAPAAGNGPVATVGDQPAGRERDAVRAAGRGQGAESGPPSMTPPVPAVPPVSSPSLSDVLESPPPAAAPPADARRPLRELADDVLPKAGAAPEPAADAPLSSSTPSVVPAVTPGAVEELGERAQQATQVVGDVLPLGG